MRQEEIDEWLLYPFAKWARMPDQFVFPRELVAWILNPPRGWFLGHTCELCGMNVPLLVTWENDHCPACGGRTSFAAAYKGYLDAEDIAAARSYLERDTTLPANPTPAPRRSFDKQASR